ncbi:UDP-N-acetylglucosamine 1-carboxyvinyltransferase [Neorickettsia helminthoeca]|nr:UDP-N-acetylglucosamine 1-carboxyvinyltransferase [Neorickettsia helminthoeca]
MSKIFIKGGLELNGEITISGSKNSSLPIIAASLLTDEEVVLKGIPAIRDVSNMIMVVSSLGKRCDFIEENTLRIIPDDKFEERSVDKSLHIWIRASCLAMGPTLARKGKISMYFPGGCAIGRRPIDFHISAFEKMGAKTEIESEKVTLTATSLHGADIEFPRVSVGATQNAIMAAVLSEGTTTISNASTEPEINDLISFLNGIGAKIYWIGDRKLKINPVSRLKGITHKVIPDRIEASTYMIMSAVVGGRIVLRNVDVSQMTCLLEQILKTESVRIESSEDYIIVEKIGKIRPLEVATDVYPGLPTDVQPQLTTLLSFAEGRSIIRETIFENRFTHVPELKKMGAQIESMGPDCISIVGSRHLNPSKGLRANDLRAGAALIIAALQANGKSIIDGSDNVERGYEDFRVKLSKCGAQIS